MIGQLPDTMRAAVYHSPLDVRVEQLPTPEPGPQDVIIQVAWCGICGTDLHNVLEGWGVPRSVGGHEYAGYVASVGDDVVGVDIGAPVTAVPTRVCGRCEGCLAGRPSLCRAIDVTDPSWQGGFGRFVRVHESQLRHIPPGLDVRAAALAEPLAVALHGVAQGRPQEGDRVLIAGAGPLGQLLICALRIGGVGDIIVSEPVPARRDAARAVGATAALGPEAQMSPLLPTRIAEAPFDLAFDCSGKANAMEEALARLRPGGTLVLLGTGLTPPRFDSNRIILHELVVTGAFNYDATGFEDALALLASGNLPVDRLLEPEDVTLEDLLPTMRQLAAGELTRKVLVRPT